MQKMITLRQALMLSRDLTIDNCVTRTKSLMVFKQMRFASNKYLLSKMKAGMQIHVEYYCTKCYHT